VSTSCTTFVWVLEIRNLSKIKRRQFVVLQRLLKTYCYVTGLCSVFRKQERLRSEISVKELIELSKAEDFYLWFYEIGHFGVWTFCGTARRHGRCRWCHLWLWKRFMCQFIRFWINQEKIRIFWGLNWRTRAICRQLMEENRHFLKILKIIAVTLKAHFWP